MMNDPIQRIGVIGGGQLAWMMAKEARQLGLDLIVQTPSSSDPAIAIAREAIFAPIDDPQATAKLATRCDVITFENEFIDLKALQNLAAQGVCFRPRLEALVPLLDKYDQRCYLQTLGLPVPQFSLLSQKATEGQNFPVVLKARRHGYDGKGTFIVSSQGELEDLWQRLGRPSMLLEQFIPFERELATIAARSATGEVRVYPVVETQQEEQVCRRVFAPAEVSSTVQSQVEAIAATLLADLDVVGVFGIEFFLTADDKVWVNEIAPRTHNSGHYTLDACEISQFEMQLRAAANLPLGSPAMNCDRAVMVNLLGYEQSEGDYPQQREQMAQIPNAFVHWYGKSQSRPGRKLGHVTVRLDRGDRRCPIAIARQVESIWYGKDGE